MNESTIPCGIPVSTEKMNNEKATVMKLEINRVVWEHGSPNMTLGEAEEIACECWAKLMAIWNRPTERPAP